MLTDVPASGPKQRRERERLETRDKILEAARELFAEHGVEAVTMREIARRIEYTPTAIYHHFADKDALIQELCDRDFRELAHQVAGLSQVQDPIERLRLLGLGYVDFALANPSHYRFMFMTVKTEIHEHPHIGDPSEDSYAFLKQTVTDGLQQGRFRPEYTDIDQLSQMFWSVVHGIVSLQIVKAEARWIDWKDTRHTAELIIDAMLRGTTVVR